MSVAAAASRITTALPFAAGALTTMLLTTGLVTTVLVTTVLLTTVLLTTMLLAAVLLATLLRSKVSGVALLRAAVPASTIVAPTRSTLVPTLMGPLDRAIAAALRAIQE